MRESLDRSFEQNKDNLESGDMEYNITRQQPMNDIFIEWVYEIDLDHEVFLVDSNPLFALSNMPDSEELFLNSIGFDSYGHRACSPSTPAKHVYNWKSAPPMVEDSVIEHYTARQSSENYSKLSIEELLGVASSVSVTEAVRTQLYEVIIGQIMQEWSVGHDIRALEALPDRGHLTERLISIGVGMVSVALGHMIFGSILDAEVKKISATDFTWLTSDICLRITTHLDDERHVKKAVLELVDEVVLNRKQPRVTYADSRAPSPCSFYRPSTRLLLPHRESRSSLVWPTIASKRRPR
ncbi:hypothetical protein B0H10DRAFT_490391 [Mycena sp. CBHHK59/15]|nr:hypothetical protein B0H10DRAFT_490391 [Mycena sp. CBHHK59/15]